MTMHIASAVTEVETLRTWAVDVGTTPVRLSGVGTHFRFGALVQGRESNVVPVFVGLTGPPELPLSTWLFQQGFQIYRHFNEIHLPIGNVFDLWAVAELDGQKLNLLGL